MSICVFLGLGALRTDQIRICGDAHVDTVQPGSTARQSTLHRTWNAVSATTKEQ
jgi:hypothetical protein